MDEAQKLEIAKILDTPLLSLTPRQIITGLTFLDEATEEDVVALGLPANFRDL